MSTTSVNLPVRDLGVATEFLRAIGFAAAEPAPGRHQCSFPHLGG
ncbi:hypothetical protein [Micromonospora sp. CPCC 205561]